MSNPQATIAPSASGTYLWSSAANWQSQQQPVDGEDVVAIADDSLGFYDPGGIQVYLVDDIDALNLNSLTLSGALTLTGTLTVGTLTFSVGGGSIEAVYVDASATLTIGELTGLRGNLSANGANAVIDLTSPNDPGDFYTAANGGEVELAAIPNAASFFQYYTGGTFAFLGLGSANSTVSNELESVAPGDSVVLPGSSVVSVVYNPSSIVITTHNGAAIVTTTFANVDYDQTQTVAGYVASYDPATGLLAITFTDPDTFQEVVRSPSGDYLWSNAANWSAGVPVDGYGVILPSGSMSVDDISSLALNSLTGVGLFGGVVDVTGTSLNVTTDNRAEVFADSSEVGTPVAVTIDSLTGGTPVEAIGTGARLVDDAVVDEGDEYVAEKGGSVVLTATPASGSFSDLQYVGIGTFALLNPGAVTSTALDSVEQGDVLELPATAISNISFGPTSLTVTATVGNNPDYVYSFTHVSYTGTQPNGGTVALDPATGLLAITFATVVTTDINLGFGQTSNYVVLGNGGEQDVYGTANFTEAQAGSKQVVDASASAYGVITPGVANHSLIDLNGEQDINNGGEALDATILGTQNINGGGMAVGTEVGSTGAQYVFEAYSLIGTAVDTVINAGGNQYVEFYGIATGTDVKSGGIEHVEASGTANGSLVEAGGMADVAPNGQVSDMDVFGTINLSGVAKDNLIEKGGLDIQQMSNESGATILGEQDAFAEEADATIGAGGLQIVEPHAAASSTTIDFGGSQKVSGLVEGEMLDGGSVEMMSGSGYEGQFSFLQTPSMLTIDAGALADSLLLLDGFSGGDVVDLANLSFNTENAIVLEPTTMMQLQIEQNGTDIYPINLTSPVDPADATFGLFDDGNGGTDLVMGSVLGAGQTRTGGETDAHTPLNIVDGGLADGESVSSGGEVSVFSGGMLNGMTKLDNATLVLHAGAMVAGPVMLSGGMVALEGYALPGLMISATGDTMLSSVLSVNDPGGDYHVGDGAEMMLMAMPNAASGFMFDDAVPGDTFAFSDPGAVVSSLLSGVAVGDAIALPGGMVKSVSFGADAVTISTDLGTTVFDNVAFQGPVPTSYTASSDSAGLERVTLSMACFCAGTRILTASGEVAVEALAIGDRLMTYSGVARPIKWIGRRSYAGWLAAGNPKVLPIHFKAGALADHVPSRDLFVSPEHAMLLGKALVPAGLLVNGVSILKTGSVEELHYFHLELDDHDVIFAEGAPTESFVDADGRSMFNNATEFAARYPEAVRGTPRYCAPRVEDGFALEALRRRLAGRAKWLLADGTAIPGILQGHIDLVRHDRIEGWARDPATLHRPVALRVFANGAEIGRVTADCYRRDLRDAGIGDGCHAFCLPVPGGLATDTRHVIEVWHDDESAELMNSPRVLESVTGALGTDDARSAPVLLGTLRGFLEAVGCLRIAGWAQDLADLERPVGLVVTANGQMVGRALANRYRGDLEAAGIGRGRHAFELVFPNALSGAAAQEIRVLREADGAEMPGSPIVLPAWCSLDASLPRMPDDRVLAVETDELRALTRLTQEVELLLARRAAREGGGAEREVLRSYRRRWGNEAAAAAASPEGVAYRMKQALVVDLQVPCATRDAGSVAILSHIRALRALGYAVSFIAADEMRQTAALAALAAEEGIVTCAMPFYAGVEDVLCRQAGMFDLVYLHRMESADRYLPLVRRNSPDARVIYSVADLHHLRITRQAQVEGRPELLAHGRHLASVETAAARRADLVLTHSSFEAELLRRFTGFGKVHVVPFAAPPRPACRRFAERHGVVVLGSFGHTPNPDAVHHLIRNILPLVWARDPTITCRVIGHGWDASRLPGVDPRVEVLGPVADLDAVFGRARLSVAPLRFGAGLKGKVLDSLAAGLPCVMTPIAAEGLELTGPLAGLVGEDAPALAELILRLHADRDANERIGELGRRMIVERFSQEFVNGLLGEALGETHRARVAV